MLLLYEGGAATPQEAKVRVRLVDFAHTFNLGGEEAEAEVADAASGSPSRYENSGTKAQQARSQPPRRCRDTNFLAGLRALLARMRGVVHAQLQADLT